MNTIKEWYLDGLDLLEDVYGDIMILVSLGIVSLLTIWRFYPLDLTLWATVWTIVLFYIVLSGALMELYIILLSEPAVEALAILSGLIVIGTKYSLLQLWQGITMLFVIAAAISIHKILFMCYFSKKLSDEAIETIEIIRNVYRWIIFSIPLIVSIVYSAPITIIGVMLLYVVCLPIICEIADITGVLDGV